MQDDRSWYRKLWSRISTAILRAIIDRTSDDQSIIIVQVKWLGDRVSADVEYKQSQGLFFRPAEGAECLFLSVAGDTSNGVAIAAQSREDSPGGDGIAEGEGGLYYAGEFKVFLDSSGIVHLGAKSGAQFVALSDDVRSELDGIKSDFDTLVTYLTSHGHTGVLSGGATSGPPAAPPVLSYSPTTPAATKVKAT